jgi:ribose 5-phosphate isomerase B
MDSKRIAIASDHAGFERKQVVIDHLKSLGFEVKDFGAYSPESSDYPDWAHPLANAIDKGEFEKGVTLCGSGNGINMTANKHQGVRSALCWTPEIAALAKQHNDANVLAIPARFVTDDEARAIVDAYLNAEFEGGRHQTRVDKIPVK